MECTLFDHLRVVIFTVTSVWNSGETGDINYAPKKCLSIFQRTLFLKIFSKEQ